MDEIVQYDINRPWRTLDPFQKEYIKTTDQNCLLLCGRQVGKSTASALKACYIALNKPNTNILMIAYTERQAFNIFSKALNYLQLEHLAEIKRGKAKPTQHKIELKNGSKILCYACGKTGAGIRGYTLNYIIVDEASAMDDAIFDAIVPALSITGGHIDLLSTPRGKQGFFYEASKRADFKKFYISAEDCPRHNKEFLETQKQVLSKLVYAQEYCAIFLDELKRFYDDKLIDMACKYSRSGLEMGHQYFGGVDVARMGDDECVFTIVDRTDKKRIVQVENVILKKVYLTEVADMIVSLDSKYKCKKWYIDTGGVGAGVYDILLRTDGLKRKIEAIDNSKKSMDNDETSKKKTLKEDLYTNLLCLMERQEIKLLEDDEIKQSLKSIQYEYTIKKNSPTTLRIYGNYTHNVEALIRACWCIRDKTLNIWAM